jgi:hypothetical protein
LTRSWISLGPALAELHVPFGVYLIEKRPQLSGNFLVGIARESDRDQALSLSELPAP